MSHYQRLCREPTHYHIFFALRVLEAEFADRTRLGQSRLPREDAVRLGQEATLAFQRTTISGFVPPDGQVPGRLTNLFFGLFGSQGPLPAHLTEYARERQRTGRDPTFVAFADMLTHRPMSLLYRAWAAGQLTASFDRGEGGQIDRQVAALSGFNARSLQRRDAMPDLAKRHFAGRLGLGVRTAEGLAAIVSAFFSVPVKLEQFVPSWLPLERGDQWRLGGPAGLGQATVLGSQVRTRASKFRIRIGPLSRSDYDNLLPGGTALGRLAAIVRNAVGDALDWDVNLVLCGAEVPRATLSGDTRLGQTSWLGDRPTPDDAADLFLTQQDHLDADNTGRAAGGPRGSMDQ